MISTEEGRGLGAPRPRCLPYLPMDLSGVGSPCRTVESLF